MAENSDRKAALHWAVENADVDQVRQLIRNGANVNACDSIGQIPMPRHPGILQNIPEQLDILKLLVKAGAELASHDSSGVLQVADMLKYGAREFVRIILESNKILIFKVEEKISALDYLAANKNVGIVEELLLFFRKRFIFKGCGNFNKSPICTAIYSRNPRMVEFFLRSGYEVDRLCFVNSACFEKVREEIVEVIEILLEYKVNALQDLRNILNLHRLKFLYPKIEAWPAITQVIAHFALLENFEKLSDKTIDVFNSGNDTQEYYESCKKQLEEMKTREICKSLTFFELLVANEEKVMALALKKVLVMRLKDVIELPRWNKFYGRLIQKRHDMIFKVVQYKKKLVTIVNKIIGRFYQWNDIISELIVSFFNLDELEILYLLNND